MSSLIRECMSSTRIRSLGISINVNLFVRVTRKHALNVFALYNGVCVLIHTCIINISLSHFGSQVKNDLFGLLITMIHNHLHYEV